jgi:hypothetical protein
MAVAASAFIRSLAAAAVSLALLIALVLGISDSQNTITSSWGSATNALLAWYGASGSNGEKWLWSKSRKFVQQATKTKKGQKQSALSRVIAAAKAAAEHDTSKIRAADDALRQAQKGLGRNAVKLHLLTDSTDPTDPSTTTEDQLAEVDSSDLSSQDMSSLIESSKKDKLAMPALAAAQRAATKNREAMENAQNIIEQSEALLGHNAAKELYSLPSLSDSDGDGGGGAPPAAPRAAALARLNALARRSAAAADAAHPAQSAWERQMHAEREERSFIRATKFAREMP